MNYLNIDSPHFLSGGPQKAVKDYNFKWQISFELIGLVKFWVVWWDNLNNNEIYS